MSEPVDTAKRFEYQWRKFDKVYPRQEKQFLDWIYPFTREEFTGRDVCDAGCGMGRNSYWASGYGVKSLIAFDYAPGAVVSAKKLLKNFSHVQVRRQSIYEIKYRECFDICFSIGVIHHLQHPRKALQRLIHSLRPGGKLIVWLYGYEGNEFYVKFFHFLHPLLRKLSPAGIQLLAYFFSLPLYLLLCLWKPNSKYLQKISKFSFRYFHLIIHDQLVPEISRYYKKHEVESLFSDVGLSDVQIHRNMKYSWTIIASR